ncbi:hypothetical protein [Actinoplanes sp. NPDC026670]|uniref:hypothetical protein n=1 Tax=Actinoplanes sp. NPDC026670 TaxID=3154700 RepID=UPI0033C91AA6
MGALLIGGSSASVPPEPEILDAPQLIALGDPAAPDGAFQLSSTVVVDSADEKCVSFGAPAEVPVRARLGEAIAQNGQLYTIRSVGLAPHIHDRVWLVADVTVASPGCPGIGHLWEFLFVAADGTVHQPAPQGRQGEFTSYDVPAGGWAGGRVFFDLPRTVVQAGAVGFRQPPFASSDRYPAPNRPYGLWPLPWPLPEVDGPAGYPAA